MEAFWKSWGSFSLRAIGNLGSVASLGGVLFWIWPSGNEIPISVVVVSLLVLLVVIAIVVADFRAASRHTVKLASDADGIRFFMHDWIRHGGRVVIWTRDMSWANNPETEALLAQKAHSKELIICLPKKSALTNRLEPLGAEVVSYGSCGYLDPSTRFTIRYFERAGAEVAVGYADGKFHVIDEFSASDASAFFLAKELVAMVRRQKTQGVVW